MRDFRSKVCVVTGAASGIGRALAIALAQEGARLALSDVNEGGLEEVRRELDWRGDDVRSDVLDVADREAVHAYADAVADQFGAAHVIVNNAGVGLGASVAGMSYDDFEWLMNINFWGVVYGTKAFLPHLERAGEGHVVNISSVFGIIGVPYQSAYNAAKFAVRGFTEALRQELDLAKNGVSASCVHPGGVRTNIARSARLREQALLGSPDDLAAEFERLARTTPEQAAKQILRGVKRNHRRILVGADAVLIDRMQRSAPTGYQHVLTAAQRIRRR